MTPLRSLGGGVGRRIVRVKNLMIPIVACSGALMLEVPGTRAAEQGPTCVIPRVTSWVVYWDAQESLQAFDSSSSWLDEVAVFAYCFDERGQLIPANPWVSEGLRTLKARTRDHHPQLLVTVVNDVMTAQGRRRLKDPRCVHEAVASPAARAAHIDQLLRLASEADGVELDYENLRAEDRQAVSQLIQELATRLHARGQWLSVVGQAKTDDRIRDGAGALDWRAIAQHADMVKIMAYHYHYASGSPGPIAPPGWVEALARFALKHIPPEKLCVVLTLYGFDWPQGQEGRPIDYQGAMQLAKRYGVAPTRDDASGALSLRYAARGTQHEVWVDDGVSLQQNIARLHRAGVRAIGFWRLGAAVAFMGEALQSAQVRRP